MSPMTPKRGSFANMDELYEFMRINGLGSLGEDNDGQLVIYTGCEAIATPDNSSGITEIREIVELYDYQVSVITATGERFVWYYQATDSRHASEQFFDDPPIEDAEILEIEIRKLLK